MKKFKRLLATVSVVLCMSMVLGMGSVFATEVQPRYIPCELGGKHIMWMVGNVEVYFGTWDNPGQREFLGTLAQCDKCGTYMACQIYPTTSSKIIGKYKVTQDIRSLGGYTMMVGGSDGSYADGDSNSFIDGFDFRRGLKSL